MATFIKRGYDQIPLDIRGFFPGDRYEYRETQLKGNLNDVEKADFLNKVVKNYIKERYWDSDNHNEKRWYKLFSSRVRSVEVQSADTLLSLFSETRCYRSDKTHTRIEENILLPEYMDSPVNVDFPEKVFGYVTEQECIFSVEHKRRDVDPFVRCDECNGFGMVKCEHCDGTGRESYVDGNYANGEERIRTGHCSECGGRGRVQCPKCLGEGKIVIYAPEYSIVKSVDEIIYHNIAVSYWTPWERFPYCIYDCYDPNPEPEEDDDPEMQGYRRQYNSAAKKVFEYVRDNVVIKNKNRHETEVDLREEVLKEMQGIGMEESYNNNLKATSFDDKNPIVAREESHIVVPAKRVEVSIGKSKYSFLVFEDEAGTLYVKWREYDFLSYPKYILMGFYYFLVKIGKLVLGIINK